MTRKLDLPDSGATDTGARLSSPSALRNLVPIQEVLARYLPAQGRVLELASGTGEHITAHAARFPDLIWQPTEPDATRREAIRARADEAHCLNLRSPLALDACKSGWWTRFGPVEVVLVVNLLHLISDAEMAVLLDEAALSLASGGVLAIYGPFLREGRATSEGDAVFDASLRAQDPAIGYKEVEVLETVLDTMGLDVRLEEMPANNLMILARRRGSDRP